MRLNKNGSKDKRFKPQKTIVDLPTVKKVKEEEKKIHQEVTKNGFTFDKSMFDYQIVKVEDLENKVVNMGDYLLVLPSQCPPLIKIYVK